MITKSVGYVMLLAEKVGAIVALVRIINLRWFGN